MAAVSTLSGARTLFLDGLQRENKKLAGGHLLERGGVEYVIAPCMAFFTEARSRTSPI
jgi:hypothetical protein